MKMSTITQVVTFIHVSLFICLITQTSWSLTSYLHISCPFASYFGICARHHLWCSWGSLANRMCWRLALLRQGSSAEPLVRPGQGCSGVLWSNQVHKGSNQVIDLLTILPFSPVRRPWSLSTPCVRWSSPSQPVASSPFSFEWLSPHRTYSSDLNVFLMLEPVDGSLQAGELPTTNSLNSLTWQPLYKTTAGIALTFNSSFVKTCCLLYEKTDLQQLPTLMSEIQRSGKLPPQLTATSHFRAAPSGHKMLCSNVHKWAGALLGCFDRLVKSIEFPL